MGAAVLAGIIFVIYSVFSSGGINNPPPGKVWSPEHGHWHDAPTVINPTPSEPSTELIPQPPGEVPDGKIWSPEHGHWHNAPNISTP